MTENSTAGHRQTPRAVESATVYGTVPGRRDLQPLADLWVEHDLQFVQGRLP